VIDLAQELGVALRPQYNSGDNYAIVEGQATRVPATAHPISDENFDAELDALAKTVPVDAPWTAPRAAEWDAMTYAEYLDGAHLSAEDRATVELMTPLSLGAPADEVSFLFVLYVYHFAGGVNRLEGIEGGAQESRVVGGSYAIALEMADALGDAVRLSTPVLEIRGWDGPGPVELVTATETTTARRAILALSPSQAAGIRFAPDLPTDKSALIEEWPTASAHLKVFVSYDRPFWRDQGLSGSIYNFDGPYGWAADASPDDQSSGILGTLGLTGDGLTSEQRKAVILESFAKCFGPEALVPTAYIEQDWGQETYTRGCTSPLAKGLLTRIGPQGARGDWPSPLGGHGDRDDLGQHHGRRRPRRSACRVGGSRRARPVGMRCSSACVISRRLSLGCGHSCPSGRRQQRHHRLLLSSDALKTYRRLGLLQDLTKDQSPRVLTRQRLPKPSLPNSPGRSH
jgi:monoamine oxidase